MSNSNAKMTDREIVELLRNRTEPVLTAGDVAEAFDVSSQAANYRLKSLSDEGVLTRRKVGGAAVVWWLVGED